MTASVTIAPCRAQDPTSCPYHGAIIRMEQAEKRQDFEAYATARAELDEVEKTAWFEDTMPPILATIEDIEEHGVYERDAQAVSSDDPRVQAGQVFDEIDVYNGYEIPTRFSRIREGVGADWPYNMRFQANRPLTPEEARQAAGAIGYQYRRTIAGEPLGDPHIDSPYSFVLGADMTKTARDDLGIALEEFEQDLDHAVINGSPVRKTDRAGAGTKGTKLIEGLNDPTLKFEIYYDSVYRTGN